MFVLYMTVGLGVGFINTPYMGIEGDGFATVTVGVVIGQIMEGLSVVVNLSTSDLTLNDGVFPALGKINKFLAVPCIYIVAILLQSMWTIFQLLMSSSPSLVMSMRSLSM